MLPSYESTRINTKLPLFNSKLVWSKIYSKWFECTWKVYHQSNPLVVITCPLEVKFNLLLNYNDLEDLALFDNLAWFSSTQNTHLYTKNYIHSNFDGH